MPSNLPQSTPASANHRPYCVGIMGTPVSSGNRGVQALGESLVKLWLETGDEVQVFLFGSNRGSVPVSMRPLGAVQQIPIIHWRLSAQEGWRHHLLVITGASLVYRLVPFAFSRRRIARSIPWIAALERMDLVGDVRGGDSFSDIYGLKRLVLSTLPVASVFWVKGRIVQFPQTYGPYKGRVAQWIARWTLRHSAPIVARDEDSQRVGMQFAPPDQPVLLSPDVAFALHADDMPAAQLDDSIAAVPLPAPMIGLNVNGLMYNGGYTGKNMFGLKLSYPDFLHEVVVALLSEYEGTLLLVPHTIAPEDDVESDNGTSRRLRQSLPVDLQRRVRIVTGDYDAHQLKGIIARCEFFLGSRMHSCIAALSQGVPCVGVAYSMKFKGVFRTVGLDGSVVDARSVTTSDAVAAVLTLFRTRATTRSEMARRLPAVRAALSAQFAALRASVRQTTG